MHITEKVEPSQGGLLILPRCAQSIARQCKGYWIFLAFGSYLDTITVQAPQPPPPQLYLVPVRWTAGEGVKEKGLRLLWLLLRRVLITNCFIGHSFLLKIGSGCCLHLSSLVRRDHSRATPAL